MDVVQAVRAVVVIAAFGVAACGESEWTATVYPNREDLTKFERLGGFAGVDACRKAATDAVAKYAVIPKVSPGWECGTQCSNDAKGDLKCLRVVQG